MLLDDKYTAQCVVNNVRSRIGGRLRDAHRTAALLSAEHSQASFSIIHTDHHGDG
jgi:hypothetical protein